LKRSGRLIALVLAVCAAVPLAVAPRSAWAQRGSHEEISLALGDSTTLLFIRNDATQTTFEVTVAKRNVTTVEREVQELINGLRFASHSNDKDDVEGAVFIVPSVVDTVPKSSLERINHAMTTYKEASGEIESLDTYPKTPPNAK
jgi:hypothetical protein